MLEIKGNTREKRNWQMKEETVRNLRMEWRKMTASQRKVCKMMNTSKTEDKITDKNFICFTCSFSVENDNIGGEKKDTEQEEEEQGFNGEHKGEEVEDDGEDIAEIEPSVATGSENAVPLLTSDQYSAYVNSIIKVVVGEKTFTDWLQKGKYKYNKSCIETAGMRK